MREDEGGPVHRMTLDELDHDGAIGEALVLARGSSRADFLRRAGVGGGALLAALAAPLPADAEPNETAILNFVLTFEYLQASFYTETERVGTVARMDRAREQWARTLGAHERAHVAILKKVLGKAAVKKPFFNFGGATEDVDKFTRTAVAMEDLTVALLTGEVPRIRTPALVAAFFSLLTVEARHATWARRIVSVPPVKQALDEPKTLPQVRKIVASTGFISSRPRTKASKKRPRFTG